MSSYRTGFRVRGRAPAPRNDHPFPREDVEALEAGGIKVRSASGRIAYLIACGLIGEPVPPVMISGGPVKKNS
jgi:hypothetical protein